MKGVEYYFDAKGEPKAVLIDLKKNPELWEDFHDIMIARRRLKEPRIPFEQVQRELRHNGKKS